MKPIFLLGEARGQNEARIGSSFVGPSGIELLNMLHDAEIITLGAGDRDRLSYFYREGRPEYVETVWRCHPEVYRSNVFQLHPPGDDLADFCGDKSEALRGWPKLGTIGWIREEFTPELDRLSGELLSIDPNLVVALGNVALWALTGKTQISKHRGTTTLSTHCASGYKLLPTYHPAAVLRQYALRPTVIMDLTKARREAAYPEVRRPQREIWISPTLEDIERFINAHIIGCGVLSVDIETAGNQITTIGFAPSKGLALVIPFHDPRGKGGSYWADPGSERAAWGLVRGVLGDRGIPKVFQNGNYDIAFLIRAVGIPVLGAEHDTMLLHHALHPEALKGLGYLGSVYTDEGAWKMDRGHTATIKRDE